jgi:histidine ammonia-lyase
MNASVAPINAKLSACCDDSFQRQIGSEIRHILAVKVAVMKDLAAGWQNDRIDGGGSLMNPTASKSVVARTRQATSVRRRIQLPIDGRCHEIERVAAMDYLSIALTTLSNLADRRVDRLLSPHYNNGLPAFLCEANQGTRLGLMGVQFMATSATAENRSLCHPVSVQTLPSTGGFQDHVSMGLVAARRCRQILDNAARIVACELLCACQAADIRGRDLLSPSSKESLACVREIVPYLEDDVILTPFLERLWNFLTDPASPLAGEDLV